MQFDTLTIVGVGLIGGAIGLAAKKRGVVRRVIGVGRDQGKLDQARALGAIDESTLALAKGATEADLSIFATPVDHIAAQVIEAAAHCKAGALLTDAGSTKRAIVDAVESRLPAHVQFVGGHPLAGSEKKGVESAHADLFVERWTVLTPTPKTSSESLRRLSAFWNALGARVRIMTPEEHDRALALTSHLPHLVAAALAGMLPGHWTELTATGFRDTTRIAGGDPALWTPIFEHNRAAVLAALEQLEERLRVFRQALTANDWQLIDQLLTQGKRMRDALGS